MGGEIVAYIFYLAFALTLSVIGAYWYFVGKNSTEEF